MRLLLASAILAAPSLVAAQDTPIPQGMLDEHTRSCVSECMQNRERDFCVATCDCVTAEMRDNWTLGEYMERAGGLSDQETSPTVQDELTQIAAYCVQASQ